MIELYVYSTMMSPENCGVFQFLKEVTFRRILTFCSSREWGHFGGICVWPSALWLADGTGPRASDISVVFAINRANDECELLRHVMLNLPEYCWNWDGITVLWDLKLAGVFRWNLNGKSRLIELFIVCIILAHQNTINKAVGGFDNDNDQKTIYSLHNFHNYRPVMHIPQ